MKAAHILAAAVLIATAGLVPRLARADIEIDEDSYGAIAYSPSTGEMHFSYNYGDRASAEQAALEIFKAKDAQIVCWVNNGFAALALGDDMSAWGVGYVFGDGISTRDAKDTALEECGKRTTNPHVVLCISSDGQFIQQAQETQPQAVAISEVSPDGQAAKLGVQPHDVILRYDGQLYTDVDKLVAAIKTPGDSSRTLILQRGNQTIVTHVQPGLMGVMLVPSYAPLPSVVIVTDSGGPAPKVAAPPAPKVSRGENRDAQRTAADPAIGR
jgi:serine/threonine-protein kinase